MTKERRLAIQMWKDIRDMLIHNNVVTSGNIVEYKQTFCVSHGLHWMNNCWFCQYIPLCYKCPLKFCSDGLYAIVMADYKDKNVCIAACNNIIRALGGEA